MLGISVFFLRCVPCVRVCVRVGVSTRGVVPSVARACVFAFVCACVCGFSGADKKKRRRKKWPEVAHRQNLRPRRSKEAKKKRECGK